MMQKKQFQLLDENFHVKLNKLLKNMEIIILC